MDRQWMMTATLGFLLGCGVAGPQHDADDDDDPSASGGAASSASNTGQGGGPVGQTGSGAGHSSGSGGDPAAGPGSGAGPAASSGAGAGPSSGPSSTATSSGSGSGTGSGGSGGAGPDGCYTEGYAPNAPVGDLKNSYSGSQWLFNMLELLDRRYHNGWYVLDQTKTDPWLTSSFPQYFNLNSWGGMVDAVDTACHEEIHGYDFDAALSTPNKHVYYMGSNLQVHTPKLNFFPRNAILSAVQQGGSVTSNYDNTYLTGSQGGYDFIFLADELTAYIGGLACATAIADQLNGSVSYRDGAAAHLYYLLIYLRIARTQYPSLYNQWQASADWQQFVRFSWARGIFWLDAAAPFPQLGINDAAIMQRVNDPTNLAEILYFTGDDAQTVACLP